MLNKYNHSSYTTSVESLVAAISGDKSEKPSLFQHAADYFKTAPENKKKLAQLKAEIKSVTLALQITGGESAQVLAHRLECLNKHYETEYSSQESHRKDRLNAATNMCLNILSLSEGEDFEETQLKSSKFLTTLVLFSPEKGKKLAELHDCLKPAYKAVLGLRLLDKLISEGVMKNAYVLKNHDADKRYKHGRTDYECYTQAVIMPVVFAAVFQDIGLQHPELKELLEGKEKDKDRFRLLEKQEREEMLALNYQYTLEYFKNGLGCQQAGALAGNNVIEFDEAEQKRLKFQLSLVLDTKSLKLGTSEIIKIPQIYASIIFSTKRDYQRKYLPTASTLISQLAVKKVLSPMVSDIFVSIVGMFPLGFGIVYITQDKNGYDLNSYEYAIVTRLNPPKPDQAICQLVTRDLMFLPRGKTNIIKKNQNLYFDFTKKKLAKIAPKRLVEIMQKLSHNYSPQDSKPIIPCYWEPYTYFCVQENQNLWRVDVQ
jgi:hypothetical protein